MFVFCNINARMKLRITGVSLLRYKDQVSKLILFCSVYGIYQAPHEKETDDDFCSTAAIPTPAHFVPSPAYGHYIYERNPREVYVYCLSPRPPSVTSPRQQERPGGSCRPRGAVAAPLELSLV